MIKTVHLVEAIDVNISEHKKAHTSADTIVLVFHRAVIGQG